MAQKYVKLGDKAEIFTSAQDKFTIVKGQVKIINTPYSKKIKEALNGGHLTSVSQYEYDQYLKQLNPLTEVSKPEIKEVTLEDKLKAKDPKKLVKYFKSNYEVSDEEVAEFEEKTKEEMIAELLKLEEEAE